MEPRSLRKARARRPPSTIPICMTPTGCSIWRTGSHRIRMVTHAGVVSTLAGSGDAAWVNGTGNPRASTTRLVASLPGWAPSCRRSLQSPHPAALALGGGSHACRERHWRLDRRAGDFCKLLSSRCRASETPCSPSRSLKPYGFAVDAAGAVRCAAGAVYVADTLNNRIRKISPLVVVTTLDSEGPPTVLAPAPQRSITQWTWP